VVIDTSPRRPVNNVDKPPTLFAGRNLETQHVYELLMHSSVNRCITIHGPPGIGKTAVAAKVCEYVTDHHSFDAVYMVRLSHRGSSSGGGGASVENPEEVDSNGSSTKSNAGEAVHFLQLFWESMGSGGGRSNNRRSGSTSSNAEDEMQFLNHLDACHLRVLFVLDGVQDVQELPALRRFLAKLLSTVDDVSLLCTTTGRAIIGGEHLHGNVEKLVRLNGINAWDSARLLMARCPRKMSIRELGQGAKISNALEIMSKHPSIQGLQGNPRAIETAAPLLRDLEMDGLTQHVPQIVREIIGDTLSFSKGIGALQRSSSSSVPVVEQEQREQREHRNTDSPTLMALQREEPNMARMWQHAKGNDEDTLWEDMKLAILHSYQILLPRSTSTLRPLTLLELNYMYYNKLGGAAGTAGDTMVGGGGGGRGGGGGGGGGGKEGNSSAARVTLVNFRVFYTWWMGVIQIMCDIPKLWSIQNPIKIDGFLSRKSCEMKLNKCPIGTFIIRFSLSKTSYLAISWVNSVDKGNSNIHHCLVERRASGFVVAFPTGAVMYLTLSTLIHNLKKLEWLYPRMHKDQAFDIVRK